MNRVLITTDFWVFDTSSIIHVRRIVTAILDRRAVFGRLTEMVDRGVLVYPSQVLPELARLTNPKATQPDLPQTWAKRNQSQATRFGLLLEEAKEVLAVIPRIIDPEKAGVEEADPYVLALGRHLDGQGHRVTVVTEERKDTPTKMSLNTACGRFRLPCLPLEAFLDEQGIWRRAS